MGTLPRFWWIPFGKVPEVNASDLAKALRSDVPPQILDVRTRMEYRNGHIEGAMHVPIFELRSRVNALPFDREKRVVTICLSAHRSIPAVRLLNEHGFKEVCQLAGGMIEWRKQGLPTLEEGADPDHPKKD